MFTTKKNNNNSWPLPHHHLVKQNLLVTVRRSLFPLRTNDLSMLPLVFQTSDLTFSTSIHAGWEKVSLNACFEISISFSPNANQPNWSQISKLWITCLYCFCLYLLFDPCHRFAPGSGFWKGFHRLITHSPELRTPLWLSRNTDVICMSCWRSLKCVW